MKRGKAVLERIMFALGMSVCAVAILYPLISNYLYNRRQDKIIVEYTENVMEKDAGWIEKEIEACVRYNQGLVQKTTIVTDMAETEKKSGESFRANTKEYEARLNPEGNGVMGYVVIPKIGVHLPIYHYATEAVLESGVGHLPESSLPVGGEGSHSVLTGHTGAAGKKIFTDLILLEIGDYFFLNILGKNLIYRVDQILTVLPYQIEELMIKEGEELCTLVTCTPYGINSHRLFVRGRRVDVIDDVTK